MTQPSRTLPVQRVGAVLLAGMGGIAASILVAALVVGALPLPASARLPQAALISGLLFVAALPLLLERWRVTLGLFLSWLVIEDLIRKLAGNDLRVYFMKDAIFLVLLFGLATDPALRGAWRAATGRARLFLYALVGWGFVMSIPSGLEDWRLPLIGLRLDFLYAPLVLAGYFLGLEPERLRRWLSRLAVLGGFACAVGLIQASLGPSFLSPGAPTPGLGGLLTVRGSPGSGPIYRPTGTFVSSGRFAWMAIIALALALAGLLIARHGRRMPTLLAFLAATGAVWVSGGRTAFLVGVALVLLALASVAFADRRAAVGKASAVAAASLVALVLISLLLPSLFESRLIWYRETLDPRSSGNEWAFRWDAFANNTAIAVAFGGPLGLGTGTESLGKQYLYGGDDQSPAGLYHLEGGYASVAIEWGWIGLALWIGWSLSWIRRQWRSVNRVRGTPLAAAGLVILGWMAFFLFFGFSGGLQSFQNYLANAYFWLLSGMVFALPTAAARWREGRRKATRAPA